MAGQSPSDTVKTLMEALSRGDVESARALYESEATLRAEPGKPAHGKMAIRAALQGFIALRPTVTGETQHVIESGDVALFSSTWNLNGTAPDGRPVQMGGTSSDVLRRQPNGTWLIVIDNPWGTAVRFLPSARH